MLDAARVNFIVRPSAVNEDDHHQGSPRAIAFKTAMAKAVDISDSTERATMIISADTVVVVDGRIFNKPVDREDGRRMLRKLSGRTHTVITGVTVMRSCCEALADAIEAQVTFNQLSDELIQAYLDSGQADDKAGAYGIQGLSAQFVARVDGDITGVIGLPLGRLREMFRLLTGFDLYNKQAPYNIALRAFPDLATLPQECLRGIPKY